MVKKPNVSYCKSCTNISSSAVPLEFDNEGICSGCRTNNEKTVIDWDRRRKMFERLLKHYKSKDNYYDYFADLMAVVVGGW